MTAEELLIAQPPNKSTELVRGRMIVREPPGTNHGRVQSVLNVIVGGFVRAHRLGAVFGQDTGFKIASNPDTVLAPDLAFVRKERIHLIQPRGYSALAPDLIAEIMSPDDQRMTVVAKIEDWIAAGVNLAWLIDPEERTAEVFRSGGMTSSIAADGMLEGEDLLPGFSCPIAELFES
jgi:Uma2 family endonuclease